MFILYLSIWIFILNVRKNQVFSWQSYNKFYLKTNLVQGNHSRVFHDTYITLKYVCVIINNNNKTVNRFVEAICNEKWKSIKQIL